MTEALESAGVAGGATITELEFDGFVGTGQMSRNARYRLTWDRPDGRPATVIGKFPSHDAEVRAGSFASGVYHHEWAFYSQLAQTVAVRTPRCWVARFDADAADFVLIMEDMAHSAQGDQFSECPREVTAAAIEQAAALHGPRWGDPTLAEAAALQAPDDDRGGRLQQYFGESAEGCIARLGHGLDADVVALIRDFVPLVGGGPAGRAPRTRWSTVTSGRTTSSSVGPRKRPRSPSSIGRRCSSVSASPTSPTSSVARSPPSDAARWSMTCSGQYRADLATHGVVYDADDCWRDYRWTTLHGLIISVCASMMAEQTERGDAMLTLMASRHGRHALDLGALDLLDRAS